jgi:predicted RNase H-like HicB family nuclease
MRHEEFDFSNLDLGIMLNPTIEALHNDVLAFNDGLRESDISEKDIKKICKEAQDEFDKRWPYMEQLLILSGHISPTVIDEDGRAIRLGHDDQEYVDGIRVISRGFSVEVTNNGVEMGHLFAYENDRDEMTISMTGWARVDQVSFTEALLSPIQAYENLKREAPEVLQTIDEALFNAESVADAIERIGAITLEKELPSHHRVPIDWKNFSLAMKMEYIEVAFLELKEAAEVYIASKLDMFEPFPHVVMHKGFLKMSSVLLQYTLHEQEYYFVPSRIIFEQKMSYREGGQVSLDRECYVPTIYGAASFLDNQHPSGYAPYVNVGVMMNEGFAIRSCYEDDMVVELVIDDVSQDDTMGR